MIGRRALLTRALALGSSAVLAGACGIPNGLTAPAAATTPRFNTTGSSPRPGGTLRIGRAGDIVPAGAPFVLSAANVHLFTLVYDTLVSYDAQLSPRPRLATHWEWSADSRRLTLTLRPDVKFHSGRPFTSSDVKFNLEHLRNPTTGSQWRNYADAMQVSAPDPMTVTIDYGTPVRSSFDVLAGTFIADPQTLDDTNNGKGFVGTGPFRFREWLPGDHLLVERNPEYWQPDKPYLDSVKLMITPDQQTALTALETGTIDWMSGVPGRDARRLQADSNYQVMLTASGGTFHYLGLDLNSPMFADQRVRQAFNWALNRPRMVDTALAGLGRPTSIVWPTRSLAYDPVEDQMYTFDLAKARQLLTAASWNTDTVVPLALGNLVALSVPMAEIYQGDLATIGVKLEIQQLANAEFISKLSNAGFGGAWMTTMAFMQLSPATFLSSAFPVRIPNTSHFETPLYKDLLSQVYTETNEQALKAELHELTRIMLDQSFIAPIAESATTTTGAEVARRSVRNAAWDTFGLVAYEDVWLEP